MARTRPDPRDDQRAVLRARGLRATSARIAVLELLAATMRPMSHADLVTSLPAGHDRTTIFRVLATLARARLVRRVDVGDRIWRYQLITTEDPTALRASFVCTSCGTVLALRGLEVSAPRARVPRALARREIEVLVHGLCNACAT